MGMAGQRRHPEWFSEGIMMVGNWEPLSFRRRAGQARFDEHDIYLREHDPKTIGRLKNLGINLIVTHFYKGFGAEAEAVEMERAARLVQEAHHHGMRVGAYLRFDAAVADTVERENSSAADWWQQDAGGGVRTYRGQDFRHLICPNHDTYVEYVEHLVCQAVEEIGFDLIHLDGFEWGTAEPCQCPICLERFQEFLQTQYPDLEGREQRFGQSNLDKARVPREAELDRRVVTDPIRQEWIEFRVRRLEVVHQRVAAVIQRSGLDVALAVNTPLPIDSNTARELGADVSRLATYNNAMWSETGYEPGVDEMGRVVTRMREFKYASALGNVCFAYAKGPTLASWRRSIAEILAFNGGHGGMVGSPLLDDEPHAEELCHWLTFYRQYRELYADTEDAAEVGIVRDVCTMTLDSGRPYSAAWRMEQWCIEAGIPYRTLLKEDLGTVGRKMKLLILPNTIAMSKQTASLLTEYVSLGGGLVVVGDTSLRDPWYRPYPDYLLRDLLGPDLPVPKPMMSSFQNDLFPVVDFRPTVVPGLSYRSVERGRVVYAADAPPVPTKPAAGSDNLVEASLSSPWTEALNWASGPRCVNITGPREVLVETRRRRSRPSDLRIHLVNVAEQGWNHGVVVSWEDPEKLPSRWRVRVVSVDQCVRGAKSVDAICYGPDIKGSVVVPKLESYTVVAIDREA